MDKQAIEDVRAQFTNIGCIMEDASVIALIWDRTDLVSIQSKHEQLLQAHHQIDTALKSIKTIIGGD